MTLADVGFFLTASPLHGFGHLRRCLKIAEAIGKREPELRMVFSGEFSSEAKEVLRPDQPDSPLVGLSDLQADVVVIDCMFDIDDPNIIDRGLIARVRERGRRTILITSGLTAPLELEVDIVVGHMLKPMAETGKAKFITGLEYAPVLNEELVSEALSQNRVEPEVENILVISGSWKNCDAICSPLVALNEIGFTGSVTVLVPETLLGRVDEIASLRTGFYVKLKSRVPSVLEMMRESDLVIGTYGNATFEAFAVGVPFGTVCVKEFQDEYASELEKRGLLFNLGMVETINKNKLKMLISRTGKSQRAEMVKIARAKVDGMGIERISELISQATRN